MKQISRYKTKQREEVVAYMKSMKGVHVTVNDITEYLQGQGAAVGMTTIYRHLEKLVADGVVKKYVIDGVSGACFEYVGDQNSQPEQCFHLKCESCGKLVHFRCQELEELQRHMLADHGFDINSLKTVYYGACNHCTGKNGSYMEEVN